MSAHTGGPWLFYADVPSTDPNWHIVTNASRPRVIANVHIEPDNAVDLANARLIAAAPDLLEALPDLSHVINWLKHCDPAKAIGELEIYQARINAAIASATGVA